MQAETKWRVVSTLLLIGLSAFFLVTRGPQYGLDLQGGTHFVLGIEQDKVLENETERIANEFTDRLIDEGISYGTRNYSERGIEMNFPNEMAFSDALALAETDFPEIEVSSNAGNNAIMLSIPPEQRAAILDDAMSRAIETLRNRVDALGVSEPIIQRQGVTNDRVLVQLPGMQDVAAAKESIGRTAMLRFQIVHQGPFPDRASAEAAAGIGQYDILPFIDSGQTGQAQTQFFVLEKESPVTGADLETARVGTDQMGAPAVNYTLKRNAANRMENFSGRNVGKNMAIILENRVQLAPTIRSELSRDIQITGGFDMQEAQQIALILRAGSLPAPLEYLEERTVDPSLGEDSVRKGRDSMIYGMIALVIFVVLYYRIAGVMAVISLALNILLVFGGLSAFGAVLTLPGIAGLILTIGMAVDANVLIFERIREEMKVGKTIRTSIQTGFEKAFLTIIDANVTTLIAAFVLLNFGTGPVKGFAVVLSIGIFTSLFSALVFSRLLFEILSLSRLQKLSFMQFFPESHFDFLQARSIAAVLSAVLILAGVGGFVARGVNFGIDFAGGTMFQIRFADDVTAGEVRGAMADLGQSDAMIQRVGTEGAEFLIRTRAAAAEDAELSSRVRDGLQSTFGERFTRVEREEMVGPQVGDDLKRAALLAIGASLIGLVIYIAIRFELSFAIAAVVALVHDVAITVGAFGLLHKEISLPVVAALLTIIGYSLNDTIVVFDRVRENLRTKRKHELKDIINESINQNLSRTMLTSVTTLLVVVSLYLFGGVVINDFAFALLIGVIIGTYSSVFVASPVVMLWDKFYGVQLAQSKPAGGVQGSGRTKRRTT